MNEAYKNSSYDLILISDSGIRSEFKQIFLDFFLNWWFLVKEDTLLDMVNHMTEKAGIVHQMPFTCDRNGFAATLEKVSNTSQYKNSGQLKINFIDCNNGRNGKQLIFKALT